MNFRTPPPSSATPLATTAPPASPAIASARGASRAHRTGPARPARIAGLDLARGIAILGTLATNIWIFSHPGGMIGYLQSPTTPGVDQWQMWTERVLQQLANGKFLGLLTLMFGIGLAIQADSAARRGAKWPGPYLWRAALLFLDGLLHYLLVVEFDVLMGYAVTGAVVAYVIVTSERAQRVWLALTATIHVALVSALTLVLVGGYADLALGSAEQVRTSSAPYREGSWWDLVLLRIDYGAAFRFEPVFIFAGTIALFLLGARLFRAGLFHPEGRTLRRRLMIVAGVAAVVDLSMGLADPGLVPFARWVVAPVVALGLLALIAEVTGRPPVSAALAGTAPGPGTRAGRGWLGRRVAEVGRVALSAYILQNVIASALFYGWGLGLNSMASALRLPVTILAWTGICVLICALAHLWLRRFTRGPVEMLWQWSYSAITR